MRVVPMAGRPGLGPLHTDTRYQPTHSHTVNKTNKLTYIQVIQSNKCKIAIMGPADNDDHTHLTLVQPRSGVNTSRVCVTVVCVGGTEVASFTAIERASYKARETRPTVITTLKTHKYRK